MKTLWNRFISNSSSNGTNKYLSCNYNTLIKKHILNKKQLHPTCCFYKNSNFSFSRKKLINNKITKKIRHEVTEKLNTDHNKRVLDYLTNMKKENSSVNIEYDYNLLKKNTFKDSIKNSSRDKDIKTNKNKEKLPNSNNKLLDDNKNLRLIEEDNKPNLNKKANKTNAEKKNNHNELNKNKEKEINIAIKKTQHQDAMIQNPFNSNLNVINYVKKMSKRNLDDYSMYGSNNALSKDKAGFEPNSYNEAIELLEKKVKSSIELFDLFEKCTYILNEKLVISFNKRLSIIVEEELSENSKIAYTKEDKLKILKDYNNTISNYILMVKDCINIVLGKSNINFNTDNDSDVNSLIIGMNILSSIYECFKEKVENIELLNEEILFHCFNYKTFDQFNNNGYSSIKFKKYNLKEYMNNIYLISIYNNSFRNYLNLQETNFIIYEKGLSNITDIVAINSYLNVLNNFITYLKDNFNQLFYNNEYRVFNTDNSENIRINIIYLIKILSYSYDFVQPIIKNIIMALNDNRNSIENIDKIKLNPLFDNCMCVYDMHVLLLQILEDSNLFTDILINYNIISIDNSSLLLKIYNSSYYINMILNKYLNKESYKILSKLESESLLINSLLAIVDNKIKIYIKNCVSEDVKSIETLNINKVENIDENIEDIYYIIKNLIDSCIINALDYSSSIEYGVFKNNVYNVLNNVINKKKNDYLINRSYIQLDHSNKVDNNLFSLIVSNKTSLNKLNIDDYLFIDNNFIIKINSIVNELPKVLSINIDCLSINYISNYVIPLIKIINSYNILMLKTNQELNQKYDLLSDQKKPITNTFNTSLNNNINIISTVILKEIKGNRLNLKFIDLLLLLKNLIDLTSSKFLLNQFDINNKNKESLNNLVSSSNLSIWISILKELKNFVVLFNIIFENNIIKENNNVSLKEILLDLLKDNENNFESINNYKSNLNVLLKGIYDIKKINELKIVLLNNIDSFTLIFRNIINNKNNQNNFLKNNENIFTLLSSIIDIALFYNEFLNKDNSIFSNEVNVFIVSLVSLINNISKHMYLKDIELFDSSENIESEDYFYCILIHKIKLLELSLSLNSIFTEYFNKNNNIKSSSILILSNFKHKINLNNANNESKYASIFSFKNSSIYTKNEKYYEISNNINSYLINLNFLKDINRENFITACDLLYEKKDSDDDDDDEDYKSFNLFRHDILSDLNPELIKIDKNKTDKNNNLNNNNSYQNSPIISLVYNLDDINYNFMKIVKLNLIYNKLEDLKFNPIITSSFICDIDFNSNYKTYVQYIVDI